MNLEPISNSVLDAASLWPLMKASNFENRATRHLTSVSMSSHRRQNGTKSSTNAEDAKYGEFIPMDVDPDVAEIRESVRQVISSLPIREQQILDFRFGLSDGFPRTLEETGKMFGVTRERVRQIQEKALSLLKRRVREGAK